MRAAARGHSIAPTEFPKGRSAAGSIRVARPPYAAAWALRVGGARARSRPRAVIERGLPPAVLRSGSQRPRVHRPLKAPADRSRRGFCSRRRRRASAWGMASPRMGAQAGVNADCGQQGNEAGSYETEWRRPRARTHRRTGAQAKGTVVGQAGRPRVFARGRCPSYVSWVHQGAGWRRCAGRPTERAARARSDPPPCGRSTSPIQTKSDGCGLSENRLHPETARYFRGAAMLLFYFIYIL